MTRLLVVHADPLVVWDRAKALELAGYEVETCLGPSHTDCPILEDRPCPLLDRADALIYDATLGSSADMEFLVRHLRDTYVDLPLVLIDPDDAVDWAEDEGPNRVWRLTDVGTVSGLAAVIERALADQGMAV